MNNLISQFSVKQVPEILKELKTSLSGLSNNEAERRQQTYGKNIITSHEISGWQILFRQFRSPFVYLLLAAAALAYALGEMLNGSMIVVFILVNTILSFYQEFKSEQALKLLQQYVAPMSMVLRNGEETSIESRLIVPGDIVIIQTGDVIPADLRLIEKTITVDESVLTGESAPVDKSSSPLNQPAEELFRASNIAFSGTTVVNGKALGVVVATGSTTAFGMISTLTTVTSHISSFEKGIDKFSRFILKLIIITLIFVFTANLAIKGERANITELILFSIALAVSVIPEALPVVTTFSLTRGALRLAKKKVVVKRLSAIEDLGSIQILCTDKTGTITENKLTVNKIFAEKPHEAIWMANLSASFLGSFKKNPNNSFDIALWDRLTEPEHIKVVAHKRLSEIPFDPNRRLNSVLIQNGGDNLLIVRGAPEQILTACKLETSKIKELEEWMDEQAQQGHRLIAIAKKSLGNAVTYHEKDEKSNLEFVGIITFIDPLKKTARQAIEHAKILGVQVKILTGDSPKVAGAVAFEVGLIHSVESVMTGEELEKLSNNEQREAVRQYNVFARVSPEQKFLIIKLLQEQYEVGFLGEGINDAPALKIANVGLVVQGATDIARDVADIVLLQPSLEVIINGIREGREVFANTIKYIKATLASNFGNFYAIAIVSLFLDYLPMLPLQILLLNLLSDMPMISIATDSVDPEELKRPKEYNVKDLMILATIFGLISTIFDFIFFAVFYRSDQATLQTSWFIGSILTELVFLYSIRTKFFFLKAKRTSATIFVLTGLATIFTIVIPFTAIGHNIFSFKTPSLNNLLIILLIVIAYLISTELIKLIYYKLINGNSRKKIVQLGNN